MHHILTKLPRVFRTFAILLTGLLLFAANPVRALSSDQSSVFNSGVLFFDTSAGANASCGTGSSSLSGSDNEEKAWNYFKSKTINGTQFTDIQTAAIIGNLMLESHLDPTVMEIGGDSENPGDADPKGWGIAQWTPGSKITGIAQNLNITGPIYQLSTQLDIVWAEMTGTAPTGYQNVAGDLQKQTDLTSAVTFFQQKFESGTNFDGRFAAAQQALSKYGGGATPAATGDSSSSGCSATGSVNCTSATGNAKILCEAEAYNGIYYRWGGGHEAYSTFVAACPDPSNPPNNQPTGSPPDPSDGGLSGNPSPCATDCSGLVDIATQAAFGTNLHGEAVGGLETDPNWKSVPITTVQPGDIVVRTTEHVEIVDHYDPASKVLYTFGSHETGTKTSKVSSSLSDWTGAYRYIGPGSSGG